MSYVCLIFVFSCRLISRVYEFLYIYFFFRVFRVSKYSPLNIFIFKHDSFSDSLYCVSADPGGCNTDRRRRNSRPWTHHRQLRVLWAGPAAAHAPGPVRGFRQLRIWHLCSRHLGADSAGTHCTAQHLWGHNGANRASHNWTHINGKQDVLTVFLWYQCYCIGQQWPRRLAILSLRILSASIVTCGPRW